MIRVIALIAFLFSPLSLADIAVVVSEDNDSSLSKGDVEQLFLGENMFFGGRGGVKGKVIFSGGSFDARGQRGCGGV